MPYERLREARIRKGYEDAADAARAFGWNEITYRAHESGGRKFHNAVERYARAFGVTPEWLLYGRQSGEVLSDTIPAERVQALAEVLLGIACTSHNGLVDFAHALTGMLQGPPGPRPPGVSEIDRLKTVLHDTTLPFVQQANAQTDPRTRPSKTPASRKTFNQ